MKLKSLLFISILFLLGSPPLCAQLRSQLELSVDKTVLSLPCPYPIPTKRRSCPDGMTINVQTTVKSGSPKNLKFEYGVSYGKIVGTGSKVIWDMTNAQPGTYEIKARVFSGQTEIGEPAVKTIRVEACLDCTEECLGPECPNLQSSRKSVDPGAKAEFNVENVIFDKTSVFTVCPMVRHYCSKDNAKVKVATVADNQEKDMTFYYIPSGGRIIGQGTNVIWDFSDSPPGKYSITVGVGNNGVISGKTVTKIITVKECDVCDPPVVCRELSISTPKTSVKGGDAFIVSTDITEQKDEKLAYKWTISEGKIVDGQNTKRIIIRTLPKSRTPIKVTLDVLGFNPECPSTVTDVISITP